MFPSPYTIRAKEPFCNYKIPFPRVWAIECSHESLEAHPGVDVSAVKACQITIHIPKHDNNYQIDSFFFLTLINRLQYLVQQADSNTVLLDVLC